MILSVNHEKAPHSRGFLVYIMPGIPIPVLDDVTDCGNSAT
jgi:hypothetical protein